MEKSIELLDFEDIDQMVQVHGASRVPKMMRTCFGAHSRDCFQTMRASR